MPGARRISCKRAAKIIDLALSKVTPERRIDLLLWAAHKYDPFGEEVGQSPSDILMPDHMDCEYFDECRAAMFECRKGLDWK